MNTSTMFVFMINNIESVVKHEKGSTQIDNNVLVILLNISISTLRGIIFEKTKGTVLQKEFLPIINPKMLLEKPLESGKA